MRIGKHGFETDIVGPDAAPWLRRLSFDTVVTRFSCFWAGSGTGVVSVAAITGSGSVHTLSTASYDGSTTGLDVGRLVFIDPGGAIRPCL
jgi:hypothetical protein